MRQNNLSAKIRDLYKTGNYRVVNLDLFDEINETHTIENEKLNFLILGKSGTGKSTLLNYLFNTNQFITGTGKPVTNPDYQDMFDSYTIHYKDGLDLTGYDSAGLEPSLKDENKLEKWEKMIEKRLRWDSLSISRNIHFIIYCVSYATARLEDYEIKYMESILKKNYRLIIIFTQADITGKDVIKKQWEKKLNENLKLYKNKFTITEVCSVSQSKLGGQKVNPFGKEKIMELVFADAWKNLCFLSISKWFENTKNSLKTDFKNKINCIIDNMNPDWMETNSEAANRTICEVKIEYEKFQKLIQDSLTYTVQQNMKWMQKIKSNFELIYNIPQFKKFNAYYNQSTIKKIVISVLNFFTFNIFSIISRNEYKDDLRNKVDNLIKDAENTIDNAYKEILKNQIDFWNN